MSILLEMIQKSTTIAILGHVGPDGDCIGSCLGVLNYIKEQFPQKEAQVYLEQPSLRFAYLKGYHEISQMLDDEQSYDLCICLDSADAERLGANIVYLEHAKSSICIDHHVTNIGYADVNEIRSDASATCEVVFSFLEEEKISKEVAECLYTGILHDTNVFKNSNTTENTMNVAGKLMTKGINFGKIIDESFYEKTYVQNQILGRALLESILILDKKCIFSAVSKQELDFYGVTSKALDGIVDQLRITVGVECAIFLYEIDNHVYKVSMRSNNYVNVSEIAAYFGGGGHIRAAGCTMSGSVHDVVNNLSCHIERQMEAWNC